MSDRKSGSRGQVVVLFAGGLVVLLAITALVVDLGFVFWVQRQERNAADPGAIAAARYIQFSSGTTIDCIAPYNDAKHCDMFKAACVYARQNDFFGTATDTTNKATGCVPANDEDLSTLVLNYPPSTGAAQFAGRPGFVEVVISRPHRSIVSGLFGITSYMVSSNAVAALSSGDSNSNSLLVLNAHACNALSVTGNTSFTVPGSPGVNGGYIMVNSDCGAATDATPNTCTGSGAAADFGGTGTTTAPHLYVVGACSKHGSGTVTWTTTPGVTEKANFYGDPLAGLVGPPAQGTGAKCRPADPPLVPGDGGCNYGNKQTFTLNPGIYYGGIKVTNGATLTLTPGIYIMAGGGFNPSGGDIESSSGDVLIYSTDVEAYRGANCLTLAPSPAANYCQGDIVINGQVQIDLQALKNDPCPPVSNTGCPFAGMLFWMDRTSSKALSPGGASITVNGGSDLRLSGTVYNPTGLVTIKGNNSTTGCSGGTQDCLAIQVISDTVQFTGGSSIQMPYDPAGLYHLDNKGLVK